MAATNGDPDAPSCYKGDDEQLVEVGQPGGGRNCSGAGAAETDGEKRKKIYSDLQKLVADRSAVPLHHVLGDDSLLQQAHQGNAGQGDEPYWLYQNFHKYWIEEA